MIKDEATVGQDPQEHKHFSLWWSKVSSVGGKSSLSVKKANKTHQLSVNVLRFIHIIS